jgi:hypothetical protein
MSPNGQSGLADTSAYLFAFAASTASREEGRVLGPVQSTATVGPPADEVLEGSPRANCAT